MRWKQFLTPIQSLDARQADDFMRRRTSGIYTLLDVRQPGEYESEHLPGAKLIPLPELNQRLAELDAAKPTIVYCAIGGRSRVAAQMLASRGFEEVYNLTGGIKAWGQKKAIGSEDLGLDLFSGQESPLETLLVAYSLEAGLRDFYRSMAGIADDVKTVALFKKLADMEVIHQDRLLDEYNRLAKTDFDRQTFEKQLVAVQSEGGLTTEEYLARYQPDLNAPLEVVSLAMSIEAQAMDLYQRAAERAAAEAARVVLIKMASEEQSHLTQLGRLMEEIK
ncbi:MAG: rhodanese-like domain-containing protein [Desulfobacterales bacterium]|jgi:rhodanese-related sulfurtransferase/rubrerythrin